MTEVTQPSYSTEVTLNFRVNFCNIAEKVYYA